MFFTALVLCILRFKIKANKGQTNYRKPHLKTQITIFTYPGLV